MKATSDLLGTTPPFSTGTSTACIQCTRQKNCKQVPLIVMQSKKPLKYLTQKFINIVHVQLCLNLNLAEGNFLTPQLLIDRPDQLKSFLPLLLGSMNPSFLAVIIVPRKTTTALSRELCAYFKKRKLSTRISRREFLFNWSNPSSDGFVLRRVNI